MIAPVRFSSLFALLKTEVKKARNKTQLLLNEAENKRVCKEIDVHQMLNIQSCKYSTPRFKQLPLALVY